MRRMLKPGWCALALLVVTGGAGNCAAPLGDDGVAARIAAALKLRPRERVLIRYDINSSRTLARSLDVRVRAAKARVVSLLPAEKVLSDANLSPVDVLVQLPLSESARKLSAIEEAALSKWLDQGGSRRELPVRLSEGALRVDGLPASPAVRLEAAASGALDIDYAALDRTQQSVAHILSLGTVRIQAPGGTDFMFRVARRPIIRQNGDASAQRVQGARIRADRRIELPAGVISLAPVEGTTFGQIAISEVRFGNTVARNVLVMVDNGLVTGVKATEGQEAAQAELLKGSDVARWFGEFALGFNPKLAVEPGSRVVPCSGCGA
ncbi:MAG: hypothetical protein ABFD89_21075, partial [Bryobacteraceae bacterium]